MNCFVQLFYGFLGGVVFDLALDLYVILFDM